MFSTRVNVHSPGVHRAAIEFAKDIIKAHDIRLHGWNHEYLKRTQEPKLKLVYTDKFVEIQASCSYIWKSKTDLPILIDRIGFYTTDGVLAIDHDFSSRPAHVNGKGETLKLSFDSNKALYTYKESTWV